MSDRIAKVNALIGTLISQLIEREVSFKPGVLATVARVDTTKDLRYTRVLVSVYPAGEGNYVLETLAHERGKLQKELHGSLTTKIRPTLSFLLDQTEVGADEVERLLKTIAEESQNQ